MALLFWTSNGFDYSSCELVKGATNQSYRFKRGVEGYCRIRFFISNYSVDLCYFCSIVAEVGRLLIVHQRVTQLAGSYRLVSGGQMQSAMIPIVTTRSLSLAK